MFCAAKISGERLQDHWSSGIYIYSSVALEFAEHMKQSDASASKSICIVRTMPLIPYSLTNR